MVIYLGFKSRLRGLAISILLLAPVLLINLLASDTIDYSESPYIGSWGNISVDHIDEDEAAEGKVLRARRQAIGTNFWEWGIQTKGSELIEVNPGSAYDISFRMKAESVRGVFFKCVVTDIGSGTEIEYFGDWVSPQMGTEWQSYSFENIAIINETTSFLQLQWMGANEDATFYIDALQVELNLSNYAPVEGIEIANCPTEPISGRLTLNASISPDTASNKSFSWSGSNDSIAIVITEGEVIPRMSGAVYFEATTAEGGFAWQSLAHAFDQILSGDTLHVGDGV